MKAFITGGSGFIGCHVLRKLVRDGHKVIALGRSELSIARMETFGAQGVRGDIRDKESMRAGMQGVDVVFHLAALNRFSAGSVADLEACNITGTKNVLELAIELDIPKIVFTSALSVYGDTKGKIVDEDYRFGGPFTSEHHRTKWVAHYELAENLIAEGAPIVIIVPGQVYGPGDRGILTDLMRRFYRGELPIFPGANTGLSLVHVEDVARGHLLAAERGAPGETYILAGPPLTIRDLTFKWAAAANINPPRFFLPTNLLPLFWPLFKLIERVTPLPDLFSEEITRMAGATYFASSEKAAEELGWRRRSLEEGFRETFTWIKQTTGVSSLSTPEGQLALALLAAAFLLFISWITRRPRRKPR